MKVLSTVYWTHQLSFEHLSWGSIRPGLYLDNLGIRETTCGLRELRISNEQVYSVKLGPLCRFKLGSSVQMGTTIASWDSKCRCQG